MNASSTKLTTKSELNLDDRDTKTHNQEALQTSQDFNQLACRLKNAIFSKYVYDYLIEKTEEMWDLYEKRINRYLQDKHLDITCEPTRPQTTVELEQLARHHQEHIAVCKRNIELFCSARKRIRNEDDKYTIQLQTKQATSGKNRLTRVPRTPRCIDSYQAQDETQRDDFE